jgi:hypothetical protein
MPENADQSAAVDKAKRAQAVGIIQSHFAEGLATLCDPEFLAKRYDQFVRRDDPVYVTLLHGMDDPALAKTFVSYWTIAQTLATQSRFWLEDAVAEIITSQVRRFGRDATHVYSQKMLVDGYWDREVLVADLGENYLEHVTDRRPWRPLMKENALKAVDLVVGEQERERVDLERRRRPVHRRLWDAVEDARAVAIDKKQLRRIADAVGGRAVADIAIHCNLLVIEPERKDGKPHVHAFRFINPKTLSSHAQRKQERANLLRLYAYIVQEKAFREPAKIQVCVAELLPRQEGGFVRYDYYPDYFSPETYWIADQLWDFIGVPFDAMTEALGKVAVDFRDQLKTGLAYLLPGSKPPEGWGLKQKRKRR